jgi:hypothetical protein
LHILLKALPVKTGPIRQIWIKLAKKLAFFILRIRNQVKNYRNKLRIGVLMNLGITDSRLLNETTELDEAIIALAGKELDKAKKYVFFMAYDCANNWDEILDFLLDKIGKELDITTVADYGTKAGKTILDNSINAEDCKKWKTKYLESQKKE